MAWWMAIPAAISAASSISGAISGNKQNANQAKWNQYNTNMQYGVDMANIMSSAVGANFNARMAIQQGMAEAEYSVASAEYNSGLVYSTTLYNDALLEEELSIMWDGVGLDIEQLEMARAVERGGIVAQQAASGTTIGDGSNEDVVVDQMTMEALDAFAVRHNGTVQAAKIGNARAKGLWEGQMEIDRIIYEGNMGSVIAMNNASAQATSIVGNARLGTAAAALSAQFGYDAGMSNSSNSFSQNKQQIGNGLTSGLFSAAGQGVSAYGNSKMPSMGTQSASSTSFGPYKTGYKPAVSSTSNTSGAWSPFT